jgi:hypothetical protein
MNTIHQLFRIQSPTGQKTLRLPSKNTGKLLATLGDWLCRRSELALPMLFVLEGPPATGKSSLAQAMLSAGDGGVIVIDGATLNGSNSLVVDSCLGMLHKDTKLVIIDDAGFCDQTALVLFTIEALNAGLNVILLVQSRRGMAAVLMGNAATGTMTKYGVLLDSNWDSAKILKGI